MRSFLSPGFITRRLRLRSSGVALSLLTSVTVLTGCTGLPKNVRPIDDFSLPDYLGTWYEIARLDHSFERGLTQVSAHYQLDEKGRVQVTNRGWDAAKARWRSAEGNATFLDRETVGHLGVQFFWPLRVSYVIFEWDRTAGVAFVSGPSHSTLWLLARSPTVPLEVQQRFERTAASKGFATDGLIWVAQDADPDRPEGEPPSQP